MKKTNRQNIQDCYESGGTPVVGGGGGFISCSINRNADGYYNGIGIDSTQGVYNADGYYNAGGDKFGDFLNNLFPKRETKGDTALAQSSLLRSEAELNSSIAQAMLRNPTTSTPPPPTTIPLIAKIGIGAVVLGIIGFVIYKIRS
jgi:hypothetical protein